MCGIIQRLQSLCTKFFSFLPRFLLLSIFCVCQILSNDFIQLLKQSLYVPWLHWEYCEECWLLFWGQKILHLSKISGMFPTWQHIVTIFPPYSWHKLACIFLIFSLCQFTSHHHSNSSFFSVSQKHLHVRYLIEFAHWKI